MNKEAAGESNSQSDNSQPEGAALSSLEQLGELPRSYGTDSIFLVAQEPHWLFTYWDIDISLHPGGKTFLRVFGTADEIEAEIEVPFETRNWYIPVQKAAQSYTVEIGYYRGTSWKPLARSITVQTPPDSMSASEDFSFATIPLHLSFQRLMDNIQTTIHDGEALIHALARLQKDGKLLAFDPSTGRPDSPDEKTVLAALLGADFLDGLSSGQLSSEELSSRIQARLEERLSSAAGGSEAFSRSGWSAAESSLFSALTAIAGGASWSSAALSSWAAAALTSWAAAAQSSWAGGSSYNLAESGLSSGAMGSWTAESISSWLRSVESSWRGQGETSWSGAALSSWLQAVTSSWAAAAMSSWSQAALTSWSQAAQSSWSHVATSSWGGSETMPARGQREFFLHVNAELIFYGGTDPRAKVTIDGQPVALHPDGSFRYHFIFPDGKYEVPITATSPDGLETRTAVLRFERGTERAGGEVGHTAQPPLAAPIGLRS
ncbi:MAG: DUF4912 domain-containing protein [Terrimicrobiaceae bacterium]|nr:DUF4912 domain-containing protein [Terrimicrobiaceae bacterium]